MYILQPYENIIAVCNKQEVYIFKYLDEGKQK